MNKLNALELIANNPFGSDKQWLGTFSSIIEIKESDLPSLDQKEIRIHLARDKTMFVDTQKISDRL